MLYLAKSPTGRQALQERASALSPRDRQIMVLANGRRVRTEVETMLGGAAAAEIDRLVSLGLLVALNAPLAAVADSSGTPPPRAATGAPEFTPRSAVTTGAFAAAPVAKAAPTAAPTAASSPASLPVVSTKRSIAATKMYTIDMLQMMRRPEASAMAASLHTSATEEELMDGVIQAVTLMASLSGNSYALKVCTQLVAMVPQAHEAKVRAHASTYVDALV